MIGDEVRTAAVKLLAVEAALRPGNSSVAGEPGRESEAKAALAGALGDALLDGTTPSLAAGFLRSLYQQAVRGSAALDATTKVCTSA